MFRMLGKLSGSIVLFAALVILGAVDVALQYLCGDSVVRHSIYEILAVSLLKGFKWACLISAIVCAIGLICRYLALLVFLFTILIMGVEAFARIKFNIGVGGDWYTLLMTSSALEMREFAFSFLTIEFFLIAAVSVGSVIMLTIYFIKYCRTDCFGRLNCFCVIFLMLGLFVVLPSTGLDCTYSRFIPATIQNVRDYSSLRKCVDAKCPKDYLYVGGDMDMIVIFVIGESSCRNYWSLYGYGRKTTSNIESFHRNVIKFSDVQACCTVTSTALRCLVTDATIQDLDINITLPAVLKGCGYDRVMISNQGHWHGMDGYESMIFSGCQKIYIADLNLPRPVYDDAIVKVLSDNISCAPDRVAYFVHLMGSHSPFDARCPKGRERFPLWSSPPDSYGLPREVKEMINRYDNSIAFTDEVLGAIINKLQNLDRPSVLIYVSDHGETPRAGSWRYASDPDCWQVPLFVWYSDQYAERFPETVARLKSSQDKEIQTDWLFHGLIELCGVGGFDRSLSFLSSEFKSPLDRRYQCKMK